jgi:hypothetical protein
MAPSIPAQLGVRSWINEFKCSFFYLTFCFILENLA